MAVVKGWAAALGLTTDQLVAAGIAVTSFMAPLATGAGGAAIAGMGAMAILVPLAVAAVGLYYASKQEQETSDALDAADAASKNASDAALQLLMMKREIKNTAYTDDEWKNLDGNTKHQFLRDINDGKVTMENVVPSASRNTSRIEPDEARMSIVGQPIQRAQVVPVADNTKSTAANDDTLKAGNALAEQQLVVQKNMLKAFRDDGAFTRFAVL